jgi:hypothetical protein
MPGTAIERGVAQAGQRDLSPLRLRFLGLRLLLYLSVLARPLVNAAACGAAQRHLHFLEHGVELDKLCRKAGGYGHLEPRAQDYDSLHRGVSSPRPLEDHSIKIFVRG